MSKDFPGAAARAGELGCVEAAVGVLRRHADAAGPLQCLLCGLLSVLLGDHAPNVGRAWRAAALPLVQAALGLEGEWAACIQEHAGCVVELLQTFSANAEAAADAAAAELLADEAAGAGPAQPAMRKSKKKRSKHPKTPEAADDKATKAAPPVQAGGASSAAACAPPEPARPTCVICLDAPPCVVLLPCRHAPLCGSAVCAAMLGAPPLCPLCRAPVNDTLAIFQL
jgi:hypothetical protein